MLTIFYTPQFIRRYKNLTPALKEEVKEKIEEFKNIKSHRKLKVHKLKNMGSTFSFSVNFKIRIIFEYQKNKRNVNMLYVGDHDNSY